MAKPRNRRKSKAQGKWAGKPKEAIVQIPLTYNDGSQVPEGAIETMQEQIYAAFGGWTIEGTVQGAYRMQSGEKRVEHSLKVSIIMDESEIDELEAMVAGWCGELGEETMLLKITDFVVKFVPPRKEAEEP
jgi:hypothetical protein